MNYKLDFGQSLLKRKIPVEIEYLARYDTPDFELRYYDLKDDKGAVPIERNLWDRLDEKFNQKKLYSKEKKPIKNIGPYIESYRNGFSKGYTLLPAEIAEKHLFEEDEALATIVLQYIIEPTPHLFTGYENGKYQLIDSHCFEIGLTSGKKFRAWFYIIENSKHFTKLFREHPPFVAFYKNSYEYWKTKPGGSGITQQLVDILNDLKIDLSPSPSEDVAVIPPHYVLNELETEVIDLLSKNKTYAQIGKSIFKSSKSVIRIVEDLKTKFGVEEDKRFKFKGGPYRFAKFILNLPSQ